MRNPATRRPGYATEAETGRWPAGVRNMYTHREPRFYASINFPGQVWKHDHELAFWYEGVDGKKYAGSDYCKTGYLMRKINNIDITSNPLKTEKTFWIYFRLGEIYLNCAEALNEYAGPSTANADGHDAYYYINEIRNRSGLPVCPTGCPRSRMRERIKHERRIELAFETHRFFDVRRWKDAELSEAKPVPQPEHLRRDLETGRHLLRTDTLRTARLRGAATLFLPDRAERDRPRTRDGLLQNPGW